MFKEQAGLLFSRFHDKGINSVGKLLKCLNATRIYKQSGLKIITYKTFFAYVMKAECYSNFLCVTWLSSLLRIHTGNFERGFFLF